MCGRRVDALVNRLAELAREFAVELAGVAPRDGCHLRSEQAGDETVLVCRPDCPVAPQERGAGALLASKAERAVKQSFDEPFEPDGNFNQSSAQLFHHAIDQTAADDGLADGDRP